MVRLGLRTRLVALPKDLDEEEVAEEDGHLLASMETVMIFGGVVVERPEEGEDFPLDEVTEMLEFLIGAVRGAFFA